MNKQNPTPSTYKYDDSEYIIDNSPSPRRHNTPEPISTDQVWPHHLKPKENNPEEVSTDENKPQVDIKTNVATQIDYSKVICPNCVHQFEAIPVNTQQKLTEANAEIATLKEMVKLNQEVSDEMRREDNATITTLLNKLAEVRKGMYQNRVDEIEHKLNILVATVEDLRVTTANLALAEEAMQGCIDYNNMSKAKRWGVGDLITALRQIKKGK